MQHPAIGHDDAKSPVTLREMRIQRTKKMEINILAMLKTAIVAGIILCFGAWALYAWLKHDEKNAVRMAQARREEQDDAP